MGTDFRRLLVQRAKSKRSRLHVWLVEHCGELAEARAELHSTWADIADAAAAAGVTDAQGKPPHKEAVRMAYKRVLSEARSEKRAAVRPPAFGVSAGPVEPAPPAPLADDDDDIFKPFRIRDSDPKGGHS